MILKIFDLCHDEDERMLTLLAIQQAVKEGISIDKDGEMCMYICSCAYVCTTLDDLCPLLAFVCSSFYSEEGKEEEEDDDEREKKTLVSTLIHMCYKYFR